MPIEPLLIFELAVLGVATGFLAGLLGIGGGMLMVPFITLILAHRGVAANLTVKMSEVNDARNLVNRAPSESEVARWIAEAATLPRHVHH